MSNCINNKLTGMYTKHCSTDLLKKCICAVKKSQQQMNTLTLAFQSSLGWLESEYDRFVLPQAIKCIELREGAFADEIEWIYVVEGRLWYHDVEHCLGQYIRFNQPSLRHLTFQPQATYAVLTKAHLQFLSRICQDNESEKMVKFIKESLFYPYYIQDEEVREFSKFVDVRRLSYNETLHWSGEASRKLALIYKGVVSIEYPWRRVIYVAQYTAGMCLASQYVQDQLEQIQQYALQPLDQPKKDHHKYRYISKSNRTTLLIFDHALLTQSPYNVNRQFNPRLKEKYEELARKVENIIDKEEQSGNYPSKKDIQEYIRRNRIKQGIERSKALFEDEPTLSVSPSFKQIERKHQRFHTISHQPNVSPSQSHFQSQNAPLTPRLTRAKTTLIRSGPSMRIHNAWVESNSKKVKPKNKNIRSFSTLRNLSTLTPQSRQAIETKQKQQLHKETDGNSEWHVAQQFVRCKLRLQYEGLMKKLRHMDIKEGSESVRTETLSHQMKKLEDQVSSKRIVRINNFKAQQKMLRNRMIRFN